MKLAANGKRFGSGGMSLLLRLVLGAGSSEVYREDIFDFSLSTASHNSELVDSPSNIDRGGIKAEGSDISSATGFHRPTNDAPSPETTPRSVPDNRFAPYANNSYPTNIQSTCGRRHFIKYIPTCFGSSACMRLSHIEVRIIDDNKEDDEIIFRRMRAAYNVRRGWIRRLFSLLEVKRIKLVKVSVLQFQRAEVVVSIVLAQSGRNPARSGIVKF